MFSRLWPKLIAAFVALILCFAVVEAWRADRRDRAQLASELHATKQLLTAADARQRDRDAQLAQTLSALDAQKRATVTPAQIAQELAKNISLPAPIMLQADHGSSLRATERSPATKASTATISTRDEPRAGARLASPTGSIASLNQEPSAGVAIPSADLKPLYDFTLDCQACQARLSVAQNDLADEKTKTAALTKERDDAVRIAKGGTAWRRVTRAAKWFLLGAAAGAIIAKAH